MSREIPDVQAGFRKGRGTRDQIANIHWIIKKQEKTFISALLTMPKPLTVWITINWKILKEMGIPDHLTCLLRNLYAGQEATVRTGHGTTDSFQIGKGVCQGCILSPCLFNLYEEHIMRNAGLEKTQAGIKIAGRNINNLRYIDDTTLMERVSLVAQMVKFLPAMLETWVRSLGWEDPLEEGMATHSSMLAWKIPMDSAAWWATVHGVSESDMTEQLSTAQRQKAKRNQKTS